MPGPLKGWTDEQIAEYKRDREKFRQISGAPPGAETAFTARNYQQYEVTGEVGVDDYFPAKAIYRNLDGAHDGPDIWIETNPAGIAVGSTGLAVQIGYDAQEDETRAVFWPVSAVGGGDGSMWANIYDRALTIDNTWIYSWSEIEPQPGCLTETGARGGTVGAWVEIKRTVKANGVDIPEQWSIEIHNATSGTFKLSVDGLGTGGETTALAWNASSGDIAAALEAAGAGLTPPITFSAPFTVDSDFLEHDIVWTLDELEPSPDCPACEIDGLKTYVPQTVRLFPGYIADEKVTITVETQGDDNNVKASWTVVITETVGGTYTLIFDGIETGPIPWDATASEITTILNAITPSPLAVISGWTQTADQVGYTVTANDFAAHTLDTNDDALVGADTKTFKADATVDECGHSLADPTTIPFYEAGRQQVLIHTADDCYAWHTPAPCPVVPP